MAVRVAVLVTLAQSPFFHHPVIDAEHHDAWARSLAADNVSDAQREFLKLPYFKSPMYPLLLGVWYRLFGRVLWAVKAAQGVLGALGCVYVFLITRKLFGGAAGYVAGVAAAIYWPWIFFDAWLLNTELVIFLDLSAAWLLLGFAERRTLWRPVAAGFIMGFSAVTWPTGVLLGAAAVLWMTVIALRGHPWRKRIQPAVLFVAMAALPVLTVTVRNRIVGKDWVLISSNGGINFYTGTRPEADGLAAVPTGLAWQRLVRETDQAGITKPSEVSRYWFRRGWQNVKSDPARNAYLTVKRACVFFSRAEPRNNIAQAYFLRRSPWLRLLPGFALVGPLWFLGLGTWLVMLKRRERAGPLFAAGGWLCIAFVGIRWFAVLPFFVCDRFRVVAVPFMLPFVGVALAALWRTCRERRGRDLAAALAVLIAAGVFVNVDWFDARQKDLSREEFFLGLILLGQGDREAAERQLLAALDEREDADAWVVLSHLRIQQQAYAGAAEAARKCLTLAPDAAAAHNNLCRALLELDHPVEALGHADEAVRLEPKRVMSRLNRAAILLRLGRTDEARRDLHAAGLGHMTPSEYALYRHLMRLAREAGGIL